MIAGSFLRMGTHGTHGRSNCQQQKQQQHACHPPLCSAFAHMEFLHLRTSLRISQLHGDKVHRVAEVMV